MKSNRDIATSPALLRDAIGNTQLARLNLGIFALHAILMISFVGVPSLIEQSLQLSKESHWKFYLPIISLAFLFMLPLMIWAEKKRKIKPIFLTAIVMLTLANLALMRTSQYHVWVILSVFAFFVAFNLLESMLPSLVSKISPAGSKGTAMGVYSTSQFLGAFCGGIAGGLFLEFSSPSYIFGFSSALAFLWLCAASTMKTPKHLSSMSFSISDENKAQRIAKMDGVVEAFHSIEESVLYLKIDKDILNDNELKAFIQT